MPLGTQVGETEKSAMAGRQARMHVAFPVLTETARSSTLTGAAIPPGTVAITLRETTHMGFNGEFYLQHPESGQVVEVKGVCKAQLPKDLGLRKRWDRWLASDPPTPGKQRVGPSQALRNWPRIIQLNDTKRLPYEIAGCHFFASPWDSPAAPLDPPLTARFSV